MVRMVHSVEKSKYVLAYLMLVLAHTSGTPAEIKNENMSEVTDLLGNSTAQFKIVNSRIITPKKYQSAQGVSYHSLDIADTLPLPVSIEVQLGSTLNIQSSQPAVIRFQVKNNRLVSTLFGFYARDTASRTIPVYPATAMIAPGSTIDVQVTVIEGNAYSTRQSANEGLLTFSVGWKNDRYENEYVSIKVYVRSGSLDYDSTGPSIWYDYESDCSGWLDPTKCDGKTWKINVGMQDDQSGLLNVKSEPVGLTLEREFIVGTKEVIRGYYTASCCHTKVDITARDLNGNNYVKYIDVERRWLSIGDVSAIVLGCILIVILVALVAWAIVKCCRRRKTLSVYTSRRSPE